MKSFAWKLDVSFASKEEIGKISMQQLWINHFHGALASAWKDGIGRDFQRRAYNICNKIEGSMLDIGVVELEDAEFELIRETFERAKCHPSLLKIWNQIHDSIDKTVAGKKSEEK